MFLNFNLCQKFKNVTVQNRDFSVFIFGSLGAAPLKLKITQNKKSEPGYLISFRESHRSEVIWLKCWKVIKEQSGAVLDPQKGVFFAHFN